MSPKVRKALAAYINKHRPPYSPDAADANFKAQQARGAEPFVFDARGNRYSSKSPTRRRFYNS